ncbi:Alpha/Beta hydrolase protein [Truncatella angustata]|uniref:Alpha/Beta hydrolase protein n=1 Tax=Truncatella angustata TaxID=152316 RepID=A0A9P8RF37_9PEZI|nr:Alpha/Beta hydrolase protein [Truncatella angustata]KAH6643296.1 Alpha/Beta hydrolase protein [Truncatella angustata]
MPFLTIRGKSIYYRSSSPEAGSDTAILFIHGLGSSNSFYAPLIPSLVAAGYKCVAFDTHGSGSSKYNGQYGGIEGMVEDVKDLMQQLKLDASSSIIVGHSMGAIVASELSVQLRLLGVVLIGPVNPNPGLAPIFNSRITTVEKNGMEAMAETIPDAATGPRCTETQRAFIRALLLSQTTEGYNSLCRSISEAKQPDYGRSQCPLLIIAGSDDRTSPLEAAKKIEQSWTSGVKTDLKLLNGIGHWHCIEAADEVAGFIESFAREVK